MSSGNSTALLKISGSPEPGEALRAVLIGSIPTFQRRKSGAKKKKNELKTRSERVSSPSINDDAKNRSSPHRRSPSSSFADEEEEEEEELVIEFQWFRTSKGDESEEHLAIVGATAPIYLVRKVDVGCHIKAVATLRSQSREGII